MSTRTTELVAGAGGPDRSGPDRSGPETAVDLRLTLLDAFELRCREEVVDISSGGQRLVALLALHERPLRRAFVAGTLWIDASEDRAAANLRSTLWRLTPQARLAVVVRGNLLSLAAGIHVDLRAADAAARALIASDGHPGRDIGPVDPDGNLLSLELLPDWYDDWVLIERERLRHLRLHALEALCRNLTAARRFGEAVDAGLAAVAAEPLRESAHRALIRAHVAEGNYGEALHQYEAFRTLLDQELHLLPSPEMALVVADLLVASGRSGRATA